MRNDNIVLFTELYPYVLYLVDLLFLCLIPVWVVIASKHPASHILLSTGWEPIITAMAISRYSPQLQPCSLHIKIIKNYGYLRVK